MTKISAPTVMVSSTYYDLRQIRTDIEEFIDHDMGYIPLLSEFYSFPVDPDKRTIENCRARVNENADIFVLIIGGRYGHVEAASQKSVTNLEYLTARVKGIPIYAFVEKQTLISLSLWEKKPDGDFSAIVENTAVFDFIRDVRTKDSVWTFEFETAQDIIQALRHQFAHQMLEGLNLSTKIRKANLQDTLKDLSGRAYIIAVEKPDAWEYKLLAQVIADSIDKSKELKRRYIDKVALGPAEGFSLPDIEKWSSPRIHELQEIAHTLEHTVNVRVQAALGAPGEPGDIEQIASAAWLIGEIYREALEWSLRVRRAASHESLKSVIDVMASFPDDIIDKVEMFGNPFLKKIEAGLSPNATEEDKHIDMQFTFDFTHGDEFQEALDQLRYDIEAGNVKP